MVDKGIGDYFISDADDDSLDDELLTAPVVVPPAPLPQSAPQSAAAPEIVAPAAASTVEPAAPAATLSAPVAPRPDVTVPKETREQRLASALNQLMQDDADIQAAALVSLDGFTMASALPAGMQPDRVGAMSAAILGLGERAAAELGRGHLSQVFIEGDNGYVLLMAAGDRAVLTVMAEASAKLGLVIYDMRAASASIAEILG